MHKQTDNSFRNGFAHESRKVFGLVLEIRKEERRGTREERGEERRGRRKIRDNVNAN